MIEPGLCGSCRHALIRPTRKGTVYLRCEYANVDPSYPRYPRLPVVQCAAYAERE